jgi:hypothetical protein
MGTGRVFACWVRVGCPVPDGLCRVCAACRGAGFGLPARRAGPIVRFWWCRVISAGTGWGRGVVTVFRSLLMGGECDRSG